MNILSMQTTIQLLYKTISGSKKKERFETILEPLQALIQIGFLSYYPIGTKITIQNNILYIQAHTYSQSVARWYNNHHVVPLNAPIHLTSTASTSTSTSNVTTASSEIDMDDIFIKISELYTDEIFKIIHHTLLAMKNDENNYMHYADGLNMILQPVNIRIKKWIDENIVF